jgi:quercetin dioxygenase-like cupin family protein
VKHARLDDMVKGWFVGDFAPAAYRTGACEVAIKRYRRGEAEDMHHHRIATEVTQVVEGRIRMFDQDWGAGDIIVIEPGEATAFEALSDALTIVVKVPSACDDKYLGVFKMEPLT